MTKSKGKTPRQIRPGPPPGVPSSAPPGMGGSGTSITGDQLFTLIGQKEAELHVLRQQLAALGQALHLAQQRLTELEGGTPSETGDKPPTATPDDGRDGA